MCQTTLCINGSKCAIISDSLAPLVRLILYFVMKIVIICLQLTFFCESNVWGTIYYYNLVLFHNKMANLNSYGFNKVHAENWHQNNQENEIQSIESNFIHMLRVLAPMQSKVCVYTYVSCSVSDTTYMGQMVALNGFHANDMFVWSKRDQCFQLACFSDSRNSSVSFRIKFKS